MIAPASSSRRQRVATARQASHSPPAIALSPNSEPIITPARGLRNGVAQAVTVLSTLDDRTPTVRLHTTRSTQGSGSRHEQVLLSDADSSELASFAMEGCFGHSVLLGSRRPATYVAHTQCSILTIDKSDLLKLFAADPVSASRLCKRVLQDHERDSKMRTLTGYLRIRSLPPGEMRAALHLQHCWRRYCDILARQHDEVYRLITSAVSPTKDDADRGSIFCRQSSAGASPSSTRPRHAELPIWQRDTKQPMNAPGGEQRSQEFARLEAKIDAGVGEMMREMRRLQEQVRACLARSADERQGSFRIAHGANPAPVRLPAPAKSGAQPEEKRSVSAMVQKLQYTSPRGRATADTRTSSGAAAAGSAHAQEK